MSLSFSSKQVVSRRWARGIFAGSAALLGALALGAGCQQVDSTESEESDTAQAAQAIGTPTCVTIIDGVNGGITEDALLSGDYPTSAFGPYFGAWTGSTSSGAAINTSLFKFNLSGLPTGSNVTVTSATMNVYASWNAQNTTVRAHQALQPWSEATVTTSSYPSLFWSATTLGSFQAGDVGMRQIDLTALAQAWLRGEAANNGLVLEESAGASHYYFTREASTPSQRPSLQVCYTVQSAPPPWQKVIGGPGDQYVASVAAGSDSSVYATGGFKGSIQLGGDTYTSGVATYDIYLTKLDSAGNYLWSKAFGPPNANHTVHDMAVGPDGSVYITGEFVGTMDFGGGPLTSMSLDVFLAKFDANGNHLWSKRFGGISSDAGFALATAPNGDVLLGGYAYLPAPESPNQFTFGGPPASLGYDASNAAFVVRLDANGNYVAQNFADSAGGQLVRGIAVDSLGRPTIAGWMEGTVGFCAGMPASGNMANINEAGLSSGLDCRWGNMFGNQYSNDSPGGVAIGPDNSAVFGGTTGAVIVGGQLVDASYAGLHVRKHADTGALLWDKKFSTGYLGSVGVDASGMVWAIGHYNDTLNITAGPALPAGGGGFVVRFDGSGNGVYQTSFGSAVSPGDVAVAPDQTGIVGGSFTGTANFGGGSVTADGYDAFIVKMIP